MNRSSQKRVLVTGAEGTIGTAVRRELSDRYELVPLTRTPQAFPSHVADIADLEAIEPAFSDVDAVIHLAASAAADASWDELLPNNIVGTYNVFAAASRAGVECVVFASTNHVIGMYERERAPQIYELGDQRVYDDRVEIRPDSVYGVSKAYGEALGRYFMELHGLRVFCLRIGWVAEEDPTGSRPAARLLSRMTEEQRLRVRAVWLSQRDCAQLIARCLQATEVRWAIVYAISNNRRQIWDLSQARALLGYVPRDVAPEPALEGGDAR